MALRYEELDMESRARLDRFLDLAAGPIPKRKAEGSNGGAADFPTATKTLTSC